jgi:hypothetical protein
MTIFSLVGSSQTFSSASGGKIYGYNNINETGLTVIAQPNPSRQSITFYNPGSHTLYVAPVNVQNVLGTAPTTPSNVALTPTGGNLGGCLPLSALTSITINGECQGGWQAFGPAGSGSANPLTVIESNL